MRTFRIMGLSFMLAFCASLKPVYAEQQFVNIILNLPNAQNYGYFVSAEHGGVQILEGQDLENQKFFTFQTIKQIVINHTKETGEILPFNKMQCNFDEEAQQIIHIAPIHEPEAQKIIPKIEIIIDNSWVSSWSSLATLKEKKILIMPVHLTSDQDQDDITKNSFVCTLHIEKGQKPGFTQNINVTDDTKCTQITRGHALSIYP
ncbi:MAG: hypothetical protein Q8S31_04390 [Alphaproteobacteria bacterium]|nr:hypothetical protein [Alphaproteobacteria bacterium]